MTDLIASVLHHVAWVHDLALVVVKCLVGYAVSRAGSAWQRRRARRRVAARITRHGGIIAPPDARQPR
jgi:hypothetical protein